MTATGSREPLISVEVVFAGAPGAVSKAYRVAATATVADVLRLAAEDPEWAGVFGAVGARPAVGIFGRRAEPGEPLDEGDRIEIYRPLSADPKSERRMRARAARKSAGMPSKSGRS